MKMIRRGVIAAALAANLFAGAARADILWAVNGVFDDGTTLSGTFTINASGYISASDLATAAHDGFIAQSYPVPVQSGSGSSGVSAIDIEPGYTNDLRLNFSIDIRTAAGTGSILASSYECQGSFNCYLGNGPEVRYLTGGTISGTQFGAAQDVQDPSPLPEPATWGPMILGLGAIGAAMRRQSRLATA